MKNMNKKNPSNVLSMVAYFYHHLSDDYADLMSDLYVDLSVIYVNLSIIMSTCQKNKLTTSR